MAEKLTPAEMDEAGKVADLIGCITQYEREFSKWEKRTEKIIKRYRDDGRTASNGTSVRFNILWSNVQTLVPATFSRLPQPDVSRRFRDTDPVGRVAALILERGLEYEVQHYPDYGASMRQCVYDRFLGGRGTAWSRYEPHFKAMETGAAQDGEQITEDVEIEEDDDAPEQLDYECAPVDYVNYKDFGHSVARTWEEVTKVWRVVYMYEDAVAERFGEELAKRIPYDASPDRKDKVNGGDQTPKQAKIYEIWCKETRSAIWLSKSLNKILDERDDPLGLAEFFPCPKPLYATITNETLVPIPDFVLYQDQADELDTLSSRIDGLIKALQVKGCYDASIPELARLFSEGGNTDLIPIKNMAAFVEKNGLKGAIDLVDLAPIAQALKEAYGAMTMVKEYIYEIMGVADIIRGQSEAQETLGAQQIKSNFAGLRLKTMQGDVAKFAADLLTLKAQIMCAKYSPQTLVAISAADQLSQADQQYVPQALALLIGEERMMNPEAAAGPNPLRAFRIEVASDSLVQMDEAQDKADRMEFLKATGAFLKEAFPVIQEAPEAAPLLVQMLKFGVTAFKVGKTIEGDFDQALDQLRQASQQPKPPPPPDPEIVKIQAQTQSDEAQRQHEAQLEQFKAQLSDQAQQREMQMKQQSDEAQAQREMALEQWKQQQQAAQVQHQNELEAQREELRAQLEAEVDARKRESNERIEAMKLDYQRWQTEFTEATKVVVATISAKAGADKATAQAQNEAANKVSKEIDPMAPLIDMHAQTLEAITGVMAQMAKPKKIVRDANGRAEGLQ